MTNLPQISEDTIARAIKEIASQKVTPSNTAKCIQKENPGFIEAVRRVADAGNLIAFPQAIVAGAMIACRLIELQQLANWQEDFK